MTTPIETPPPRSRRWPRHRGRGGVIAAVVVAVLVVGAVVAALIGSSSERTAGPGMGRAADSQGLPVGRDDRGDDRGHGPRGPDAGDSPVLVGTVVSTTAGTITITPDGGTARTLRTDGDTRVRGNGNTAVGDVQAGERAIVRVAGSGDTATAVSIEVPKASVTGTVTALAGDTATITSVDGLVVSANLAALSQKPVVGDVVVLTGTVANGTTITADGIRVLPKAT